MTSRSSSRIAAGAVHRAVRVARAAAVAGRLGVRNNVEGQWQRNVRCSQVLISCRVKHEERKGSIPVDVAPCAVEDSYKS